MEIPSVTTASAIIPIMAARNFPRVSSVQAEKKRLRQGWLPFKLKLKPSIYMTCSERGESMSKGLWHMHSGFEERAIRRSSEVAYHGAATIAERSAVRWGRKDAIAIGYFHCVVGKDYENKAE